MKNIASNWFKSLQDKICLDLESLENQSILNEDQFRATSFTFTDWSRDGGGGGTMGVLRGGRVFEKAGVNFSAVHGQFPAEFASKIPGADKDPTFWASGISIVIHPRSPLVPIIHMNTRMIVTTKTWFGGGIDLTPVYPTDEDTEFFHSQVKNTCDQFDTSYYDKFKKSCDEYFYIHHRNEPRGVGGIFYDNLNSGNLEQDFEFSKAVGNLFINVYRPLVKKYFNIPWETAQTQDQLHKRAKYTEFNLIYDKGTEFGLKTGGNIEAIFVSLPPMASWQ